MKVYCKKSYFNFQKGKHYKVIQYSSVFEKNDFITIESDESLEHRWYRFRLNKSLDYIDDYLGKDEAYFYDFFTNIKYERKKKLLKIGDN